MPYSAFNVHTEKTVIIECSK